MDGSGVPGIKSSSSLFSKKSLGQERCGRDGKFAAGMDWNRILAAVEAWGRGGEKITITKYIKKEEL